MTRVEVFQFRILDYVSGKTIPNSRLSTMEFIEFLPGGSVDGGVRLVDRRLIDPNGRLVLDPSGTSAKLLRNLDVTGSLDETNTDGFYNSLNELMETGLVRREELGEGHIVFSITEIGRLFVLELFDSTPPRDLAIKLRTKRGMKHRKEMANGLSSRLD